MLAEAEVSLTSSAVALEAVSAEDFRIFSLIYFPLLAERGVRACRREERILILP